MWIAKAKNGKEIKRDFWDWCLMNVIIENYKTDGLSYDDAYQQFWNDVREFDPEEYDLILLNHDGFDNALGNGYLDELRNDYLLSLDMEADEIIDEQS